MKKLIRLAAALSMTALLASCGGGSGASDEFVPALDKNTACTIKVAGDYGTFEALEEEFYKFNNKINGYYPNVKLVYSKVDDYSNTIGTVLSKETDTPNIFFTYAAWMSGDPKYDIIRSHMEDLTDPALKLDLDCIRPGLLNRDSSGKVFMVPVFSRAYGTLVNHNLFKKENVEIPTKWSELLAACETFKTKEYKSPMMGYSLKDSSCLMNTIAYPGFVAALAKNPEMIEKANNLDPSAGEYMRDGLTKVKTLVDNGAIDINECDTIEDNYNKVIMRFFEGDVPMMICAGDTVSGTKKRESQSEAFTNNPFEYSFVPIPMTEEGGYFIDSPSIQFSVNKNCENLDMTNEFMRFLVRKQELNAMAAVKHLVTTTKELSFDPVYAAFGKIPEERTFSPEVLGVKDPLAKQIRVASYKVGKGSLTVNEAVEKYGTF